MIRDRNKHILDCFTYDEEQAKYTCNLGDGNCSFSFKSGFHTGNARKHLSRAHTKEFEDIEQGAFICLDIPEVGDITPRTNIISSLSDVKRVVPIDISQLRAVELLIDLFSSSGRPFSLLNDGFFKYLAESFSRVLNISFNREKIQEYISAKADLLRAKVSNVLRGKVITLKLDIVSRHRRKFIGINCQYLDNFVINVVNLDLKEVNTSITAEVISNEIINSLNSYDLNINQFFSVTVDNGTNVVKSIDFCNSFKEQCFQEGEIICGNGFIESDFEEDFFDKNFPSTIYNDFNNSIYCLRCVAHTLQLCVKDFLDDYQSLLSKIRSIVKKFRTFTYKSTLDEHNLHVPVLDNITRWTSTFNMVNDFLLCKPIAIKFIKRHDSYYLSNEEWKLIEQLLVILKFCNDATVSLQNQQMTFSDSYYFLLKLKIKVEKVDNEMGKPFLTKFEARFDHFMNKNSIMLASLYVDPRFQVFLDSTQKKIAIETLECLSKKIEAIKIPFNETQNELDRTVICNDIDGDLDEVENELNKKCKATELMPNSSYANIRSLENLQRIKSSVDLFEYWKARKFEYLEVKDIIDVILAIPATQVSVERTFSDLKYIISDTRTRLTEKITRDILFLRIIKRFNFK